MPFSRFLRIERTPVQTICTRRRIAVFCTGCSTLSISSRPVLPVKQFQFISSFTKYFCLVEQKSLKYPIKRQAKNCYYHPSSSRDQRLANPQSYASCCRRADVAQTDRTERVNQAQNSSQQAQQRGESDRSFEVFVTAPHRSQLFIGC